jgi:hypothetical protein
MYTGIKYNKLNSNRKSAPTKLAVSAESHDAENLLEPTVNNSEDEEEDEEDVNEDFRGHRKDRSRATLHRGHTGQEDEEDEITFFART